MPVVDVEGFVVRSTWDDGKKTKIEVQINYDKDKGPCVKIDCGINDQIFPHEWPLVREKINQLFRKIEKEPGK